MLRSGKSQCRGSVMPYSYLISQNKRGTFRLVAEEIGDYFEIEEMHYGLLRMKRGVIPSS
jgi:hypothetical protein